MGLTQKDIAQNLGISFITVNRAFNDSGYVSPELKQRIFDYAKKHNYVPHRASQILVRNKVQKIAAFTSTFPEYFWDDIKRGLDNAGEYIKPLNYEVHYHRVPDFDTESFFRILKKEIRNGLSAAAFLYLRRYDMRRIIDITEKAGIPYIFFNVDSDQTEKKRLCYIGPDYLAGGKLVANFIGKSLSMKAAGKVLVISILEEFARMKNGRDINLQRVQGFREVMERDFPYIACHTEYLHEKTKSTLSVEDQIKGHMKKYKNRVDAVYFVPAYNGAFLDSLEMFDYSRAITVLHDVTPQGLHHLERSLLTAMVFQDPILQGYMTVKTLESVIESKTPLRPADIEIVHTLIFKENINFLKNHYLIS